MKIDYTNLSFTQLIDKIEANRFFDLPRMVREAFRRLLTRVEALEDSPSGDSRPYKVYTALLSQTGTDAPVATVLENTIGTVTFEYYGIGNYSINSTGLFTSEKTAIFHKSIVGDSHTYTMISYYADSLELGFSTSESNTPQNDLLVREIIEIRVYN